jgi:NAD+ synthase (glutamine-hydrolysing)
LAWDGHAVVYENGDGLAESERFAAGAQLVMADVDLERLVCDRMRTTSFTDAATDHRDTLRSWRHIELDLHLPTEEIQLDREVPRFPCRPIRPGATSAVPKSTTSRWKAWQPGWPPPGSTRW